MIASLAFSFIATASALQFVTPTANQVVSRGSTFEVKWKFVSTDPKNFSLGCRLQNNGQNTVTYLFTDLTTSLGKVTIDASKIPTAGNYTLWAMNSVIGNTILAESQTFQAVGTGDSVPASPSTSGTSTESVTKNHHGKSKHSHSGDLSDTDPSGSEVGWNSDEEDESLSTLAALSGNDESAALSGSFTGDSVTGKATTGSTPTRKVAEPVADVAAKHTKTISANDDDSLSGGDGLPENAAMSTSSLSGSAVPSSNKSGATTLKFTAASGALLAAMGIVGSLALL